MMSLEKCWRMLVPGPGTLEILGFAYILKIPDQASLPYFF